MLATRQDLWLGIQNWAILDSPAPAGNYLHGAGDVVGLLRIQAPGLHSGQDGQLPRCHGPRIRVDLLWRQAQDGKANERKAFMLKSLSTALILRGIGAVALGIMAFGISLFACAAMGAVTLVTHRNAA